MTYYRCKCGKSKSWSSMGVERCQRCPECGSDLAGGPDGHRDPEPRYDQDTGERMADVCRRCLRKRKDGET